MYFVQKCLRMKQVIMFKLSRDVLQVHCVARCQNHHQLNAHARGSTFMIILSRPAWPATINYVETEWVGCVHAETYDNAAGRKNAQRGKKSRNK